MFWVLSGAVGDAFGCDGWMVIMFLCSLKDFNGHEAKVTASHVRALRERQDAYVQRNGYAASCKIYARWLEGQVDGLKARTYNSWRGRAPPANVEGTDL